MQEGSFRCDANVSVRPLGQTQLGTRREIKNLNSFRFLQQAIDYEVQWQIDTLEDGGSIEQATVLFDPDTGETRAMRSKEDAHDYRYFPDPDLLPLVITDAQIEDIRTRLPELPVAKKARFIEQYGLPEYDAGVLVAERELADFFEETVKAANGQAKQASNWIMVELLGALNKAEKDITESPVSAAQLGGLINRIGDNTITGKIAKQVFALMLEGGGESADALVEKHGLKPVTDSGAIEAIIDEVIAANPQQVADYRGGKDKLFGFFVGQCMKASKGKANPAQVNALLKQKLG